MCICDWFLSIWTNTGLHLIHHKQKSHLGCLWSKWTEHRKWMRMTIKLGGIKINCVIFCHYCDIDYFQAGFLNNPFVFHWSCKQNCPNPCHWLSQCWAGPDAGPDGPNTGQKCTRGGGSASVSLWLADSPVNAIMPAYRFLLIGMIG